MSNQKNQLSQSAGAGGGCRIHRLHLSRRVPHSRVAQLAGAVEYTLVAGWSYPSVEG